MLRPVADGTRRPQRGPARLDRFQHGGGAADIEIGLLLPGKGQARQVFGGGGRAHGHQRFLARQAGVGAGDGFGDGRRHGSLLEQLVDGL